MSTSPGMSSPVLFGENTSPPSSLVVAKPEIESDNDDDDDYEDDDEDDYDDEEEIMEETTEEVVEDESTQHSTVNEGPTARLVNHIGQDLTRMVLNGKKKNSNQKKGVVRPHGVFKTNPTERSKSRCTYKRRTLFLQLGNQKIGMQRYGKIVLCQQPNFSALSRFFFMLIFL